MGFKLYQNSINFSMVPGAGIEPARYCYRGILSPLCLPISPPGHQFHETERATEQSRLCLLTLSTCHIYLVIKRVPFKH